jgi:hypothetical protein
VDSVATDEPNAMFQFLLPYREPMTARLFIATAILRLLVGQVDSVYTDESDALCQVLLRYLEHMATRPGHSKQKTYAYW